MTLRILTSAETHRRLAANPMTWLAATCGAVALLAAGGGASAATTLSAGWTSGCGKDTCFSDQGVYAVTFSAGAFKGPIDVSKLFLDRSVLGTMGSQFFTLSFMQGGKTLGSWGQWNMGSVAGDELSFTGSDLVWNPADGDLVLVLELVDPNGEKWGSSGTGDGGGGGSFFFRGAAAPPEPDPGTGSGSGSGTGTVQFDPPFQPDPPPATNTGHGAQTPLTDPVPEPAAWLLMIGGFGLAGAALRRQRGATGAPV